MGDFQTFVNEIIESRRVKITEDKASLEKGIKYKEADLNYYIKGLQADRFRLIEYDKRLEALVDTAAKLTICVKNIEAMKYVNGVTYDVNDKSLLIHTSGEMKAYTQGNDEIILGPLVIEIFINKNEVAVFCDEDNGGGYGYWTDHDPHPHVSGSSGKPCLGDVESPIALAFSSYDYDIVAMLMLEFLQSVNTNDPAGEKYTGWSHTNEDGEFFEGLNGNEEICSRCNSRTVEDDMHTCDNCSENVCSDCSVYIAYENITICNDCYTEYYDECTTCNTRRHIDELYYCTSCSDAVCGDCIIHYNDEEHLCPSCAKDEFTYCSDCEKLVDNNEIYECEKCGKKICVDCITDGVCNECIKEEYSNCEICNKLTDNANVLKCQECGKWVCEDCIDVDRICNKCIEEREDVLEDIQEEEDAGNDCEGECIGNCLACMEEKTRELLSRVDEALQEEAPPLGEDEGICDGCGKIINERETTIYYASVISDDGLTEAVMKGKYYCTDCVEGGKIDE